MLKPLPKKMTKRNTGKHYDWSVKLELARGVAEHYGCDILLTDAAYQIAKIQGDGINLVLYPHTNSNRVTNIRTRDEGSKNATRTLAIADALSDADPTFNTFYMKARHKLYERSLKQINNQH